MTSYCLVMNRLGGKIIVVVGGATGFGVRLLNDLVEKYYE